MMAEGTEDHRIAYDWPSVLIDNGYRFTGKILYQSHETQVGLFHHDLHGDVVVKIGEGLEYEYRVGRRLYELSLNNGYNIIAKSIAWFPIPDTETIDPTIDPTGSHQDHEIQQTDVSHGIKGHQCLVMEYIKGQTLDLLLDDMVYLPLSELRTLIQRYIAMLKTMIEFQELVGFTHYDLHLGNVITNDNLATFTLIDFGYAHLTGITGVANVHDGALGIGVLPGIRDPWIDIARLVVLLYSYLGYGITPDPMGSLLLSNGFSSWCPSTHRDDPESNELIPSWIWLDVQRYPGAELIPGIEGMYTFPSSIWSGGFPVVECQLRSKEASGFGSSPIMTSFVSFMTELKQQAIARRILPLCPELLVLMAEEDLERRLQHQAEIEDTDDDLIGLASILASSKPLLPTVAPLASPTSIV